MNTKDYVSPYAGQKNSQMVGGRLMEGTYNQYGRWVPDAYAQQKDGPNFQFDRPDIATSIASGTMKAPEATYGKTWADMMAEAPDSAQTPGQMTNYLQGVYGLGSNRYVDAGGNIRTHSPGKTLAKIGLTAAPILAAPFTGGSSLLALSMGAGAAAGALDGGWRGAIMGGAMGAIPGAAGASNTAATYGASQALKRAILNPSTMARFGSFLPGRAGQVANVAGMAFNTPGLRGRFSYGGPSPSVTGRPGGVQY